MVLDILIKQGVPVAYTRAHITARVLTKRDRIGKALDVDDPVAALEIDHVTCTAEGAPVEHSNDIFLPRSLDLHVMRWLEDMPPSARHRARRPGLMADGHGGATGMLALRCSSTVAVGTDGSATASKAVEAAVEIAQRFDAKLVLLSACRGLRETHPMLKGHPWSSNGR